MNSARLAPRWTLAKRYIMHDSLELMCVIGYKSHYPPDSRQQTDVRGPRMPECSRDQARLSPIFIDSPRSKRPLVQAAWTMAKQRWTRTKK